MQSLKILLGNFLYLFKVRKKFKKGFCKKIKQFHSEKKNVSIIVNIPVHGNLGDQAIVCAEREFVKKTFPGEEILEFTDEECQYCFDIIKRHIKKNDNLFILGGGNFGSLWKFTFKNMLKIIEAFPNNKKVIFPQTAFFEKDKEGEELLQKAKRVIIKDDNLVLCARDQKTYEFFQKKFGIYTLLIPDIVLSYQYSNQFDRNEILLCFRKDKEKNIEDKQKKLIVEQIRKQMPNVIIKETDTVLNKRVESATRVQDIENKLDEFARAKLVVTDRLHGMIFSAITRTPCIVFDNLDGKVFRVYRWVQHLNYIICIDTIEEIKSILDERLDKNNTFYLTDEEKSRFFELQKVLEEFCEKR